MSGDILDRLEWRIALSRAEFDALIAVARAAREFSQATRGRTQQDWEARDHLTEALDALDALGGGDG
ncbi:MAG: hypothetical protein FWC87_00150 [Acidimicrobiaceae bacterium]|nr:hypothetical protein [Acidimicrobiaceae bacterium]